MLPNGAILRLVAAEVIPAMAKGAAFIDCSTVDVDSARAVPNRPRLQAFCPWTLRSPVASAALPAAPSPSWPAGSAQAFAAAEPLFEIMGQKAVHCGEAGAGQAAKICNNMILGVTMIATCEAFALADKLGLDRQKMFDVVSTSSGYSWTMNAYCPAPGVGPQSPADNNYQPGFAAELMLKDLGLSQQAAKAPMPTPRWANWQWRSTKNSSRTRTARAWISLPCCQGSKKRSREAETPSRGSRPPPKPAPRKAGP